MAIENLHLFSSKSLCIVFDISQVGTGYPLTLLPLRLKTLGPAGYLQLQLFQRPMLAKKLE